ncbi:restriction endonuclease [Streptomyces sp. NPDC056883]|uniref:nSTAND3 domain-containing NTPase n=1 Tax=Streptomyces sp. NPDC056883 TaxID=3345959 RepID=UPI00369C186C
MTRNYADLSPHDFELLVRDLLQAEFGVRMETFPAGRDGGVDVRLHHGGEDSVIIQCKHSPGRSFAQIRSQLQLEARKIGRRFSCRYMLATSASLTRANKREVVQMFSGVSLSETDILGVDDLDNLLTLHPQIETQNFKLWITSSAVLQHLMNSDLHLRSAGLVERIVKRRRLYVHSEAHTTSLEMLEAHHVCVISGEPGIGKTTLAETLLVRLLADGWEVHTASEDISEIERVWQPGRKQAFLYDDFLGQNSLLDSLNKNEDSRLVQIAERVSQEGDKRLIMTTREYILRQARQIYPRLKSSPLLYEDRVVLNLGDYTRLQKAKIFYNHIHFAGIEESALRSILSDRKYVNVVEHANFSPRVIELVASNFRNSGVPGSDFYQYTMGALDNPRDLWDSIFQDQLSQAERGLLLVLATVRRPVEVSDLFEGVSAYQAAAGVLPDSPHRLSLALKKLQGTFVRVAADVRLDDQARGFHPGNYSTVVQLANPSFIDFVSSYLSSHPGEISQVARGAVFFEQVETLVNWDIGGNLDERLIASLMDSFFGSRNRVQEKTHPRLAPGQQHVLMGALRRLVDAPSCYWVEGMGRHSVEVRQQASLLNRHLVMLMLDAKYRHGLLPVDALTAILEGLARRVEGEAELSVRQEIRLISYLGEYSEMGGSAASGRDMLALRLMGALDLPEDFEIALSPFKELSVPSSDWSVTAEAGLRRRFQDFLSGWDISESGRVNTVADCQDSISRIASVVEYFELDGVDTPVLKDRLELLEDEVAQDLDFSEEESAGDDIPAQYPLRSPALREYEPQIDPVDELFQTLGD